MSQLRKNKPPSIITSWPTMAEGESMPAKGPRQCHKSQPTLGSPRTKRGRIRSLSSQHLGINGRTGDSQSQLQWMTSLDNPPNLVRWEGATLLPSHRWCYYISLRGLQAACNPLLVNRESERFNNCFCLGCLVKASSLSNETKGD